MPVEKGLQFNKFIERRRCDMIDLIIRTPYHRDAVSIVLSAIILSTSMPSRWD